MALLKDGETQCMGLQYYGILLLRSLPLPHMWQISECSLGTKGEIENHVCLFVFYDMSVLLNPFSYIWGIFEYPPHFSRNPHEMCLTKSSPAPVEKTKLWRENIWNMRGANCSLVTWQIATSFDNFLRLSGHLWKKNWNRQGANCYHCHLTYATSKCLKYQNRWRANYSQLIWHFAPQLFTKDKSRFAE